MWLLLECLYGLKQAPWEWNAYIDRVLQNMGFNRLSTDFGVCLRGEGDKVVYIAL